MAEKRRKPWVAGLLSVLLPGLGHVYVGQVKKGFALYCVVWLAGIAAFIIMMVLPLAPFNTAVPLPTWLLLYLYIVIDAIRAARRQGDSSIQKVYRNRYVQLLVMWAVMFVMHLTLTFTMRSAVQPFRISSGSMQDTLLAGDYILTNKSTYGIYNPLTNRQLINIDSPQRGDVIVFRFPQNESRTFIFRLIGLPGEQIDIREKRVHINGLSLDEPYAKASDPSLSPRGSNFGPIVVPPGHFFVLGDYRDRAMDSRAWGFLPEENVIGKAVRVYWSWDRAARRVRWERIGQTIR